MHVCPMSANHTEQPVREILQDALYKMHERTMIMLQCKTHVLEMCEKNPNDVEERQNYQFGHW